MILWDQPLLCPVFYHTLPMRVPRSHHKNPTQANRKPKQKKGTAFADLSATKTSRRDRSRSKDRGSKCLGPKPSGNGSGLNRAAGQDLRPTRKAKAGEVLRATERKPRTGRHLNRKATAKTRTESGGNGSAAAKPRPSMRAASR
jgi:hypothetical protein